MLLMHYLRTCITQMCPCRCAAPEQDPPVLPYLRETDRHNYDIQLEADIVADGGGGGRVTRSNFKHLCGPCYLCMQVVIVCCPTEELTSICNLCMFLLITDYHSNSTVLLTFSGIIIITMLASCLVRSIRHLLLPATTRCLEQ